ncbi:MAG: group I truncated hemoglobin [Acidimicrobiales bacterium]
MSVTLYDRLRGEAGISDLVDRVVDLHLANPTVATRFAHGDLPRARAMAKEFFAAGSGGPVDYSGKSMLDAHAGMNISEQEFLAVVDDIMNAMAGLGYEPAVRNEVLAIAYSLKDDIVRV